MVGMEVMKGKRAAPLPAEERRAAILTAALPLVREHGLDVTTKAIAEAAGIAEGTIFRVFKDKDELVQCVVDRAFDTGRLERQIAEIDLSLPLEERLLIAARLIQKRLSGLWQLMAAMRMGAPPHPQRAGGGINWDPKAGRDRDNPVIHLTTRLFEPDAEWLTCSPEQAARLLRLITFSGSHPLISHGQPLSPEEIVDLLLHGITTTPRGDI